MPPNVGSPLSLLMVFALTNCLLFQSLVSAEIQYVFHVIFQSKYLLNCGPTQLRIWRGSAARVALTELQRTLWTDQYSSTTFCLMNHPYDTDFSIRSLDITYVAS